MNRLENLKEIADRNLGGLKADARLLRQIQNARAPKTAWKKWRPVLVVCTAAAVLLCAGFLALPQLMGYNGDIDLVTRSAGGDHAPKKLQLTASVPAGSVSIGTASMEAPAYRSLFAPGQNANFPLVKVGRATYRLLTDPTDVSDRLLGNQLGSVTEFTSEPAVSSGGIVSNIVQTDRPVYAVKGMKGALVIAEVNGSLRVFQRVSYSGTAILGSETLRDVLTGSASAVAMQLSDVGSVVQADQARELMNILLQYATYEGAAVSASRSQSLLIKLDNGLTVQMNAGSGTLSACGTWSCPEFFDAFADAVAE